METGQNHGLLFCLLHTPETYMGQKAILLQLPTKAVMGLSVLASTRAAFSHPMLCES